MWQLTALAVATVFATLGLARTLTDELRDRQLVDLAFSIGLLLVLAAIAAHGLRVRPAGIEVAAILGITAVYIIVLARIVIPEERSHLIEYSVVALLIHEALLEREHNGRPVPAPAMLALAATVAIGALDELVQLAIPSRVFDWRDIGFNTLAAILAIAGGVTLRAARRRVGDRTAVGS